MEHSLEELPELPREEDLKRAKRKLESFLRLTPEQQAEYLATQDSLINYLFTDLGRLKQELTVAGLDDVTGLPLRRAAREAVRVELKRANRLPFPTQIVIALVDVEGLGEVNNTEGYPAGSALLERIARSLQRSVRETDIVSRWGGDEFLVFFPQADGDVEEKYRGKWEGLPIKAWFVEREFRPHKNRRDHGIRQIESRLIREVEHLHKIERRVANT